MAEEDRTLKQMATEEGSGKNPKRVAAGKRIAQKLKDERAELAHLREQNSRIKEEEEEEEDSDPKLVTITSSALTIVAIVLIAGAGYYMWQQQQQPTPTKSPPPPPQPVVITRKTGRVVKEW